MSKFKHTSKSFSHCKLCGKMTRHKDDKCLDCKIKPYAPPQRCVAYGMNSSASGIYNSNSVYGSASGIYNSHSG